MNVEIITCKFERTGRTDINAQTAKATPPIVELGSFVLFSRFGFQFSNFYHVDGFVGADISTVSTACAFIPVICMKAPVPQGRFLEFKRIPEGFGLFKE